MSGRPGDLVVSLETTEKVKRRCFEPCPSGVLLRSDQNRPQKALGLCTRVRKSMRVGERGEGLNGLFSRCKRRLHRSGEGGACFVTDPGSESRLLRERGEEERAHY